VNDSTNIKPRAYVPCGLCTACCRRELILVHPEYGDNVDNYDTRDITIGPSTFKALRQRPDGACVYLSDFPGVGCTIWERAPAICREFDCRGLFVRYSRAQRRDLRRRGLLTEDILNAGRERLNTLRREDDSAQKQDQDAGENPPLAEGET
jgi:hypothetical protein